jgi:hypothetical protein
VSRARICARNIHRLREIRDAANNMPAVQAIRDLERTPDDEAASQRANRSPGVVIIVHNGATVGTPSANPVQVIDNSEDHSA